VEPFATAAGLAAAGGLVIAATLLSPLSQRIGVPVLLVVLGLGMLAGSEGVGGIPFDDHRLAFRVGTLGLVLILFDGGLDIPTGVFRRVLARGAALATVGVLLTAAAVAAIGMALGLSPAIAILVGSVVSSTDAAAVFSVLRSSRVRLKEKTGATLEVESGLNDPIAFFLTVMATEVVLGERTVGPDLLPMAVRELGVGALCGIAIGYGGRMLLHAVELPVVGLYPVLTTATALVAYGVPMLLHGNGFLAAYLAGVVVSHGPLPYRAGIRRVHDALAWLAQIAMFLMLGLLVFPSLLVPTAAAGLVVAAALTLVARPLAVLVSLAPFEASARERFFIAWVGLRGAVPIVLATYPVLRGVPEGQAIFHVVFFVVLVNGLVTGATVGWLARRLRLAAPTTPSPPAAVELVSMREFPGEFAWYSIERASAVCGAAVQDVPLPDGCVLTILLHDEAVIAPRGDTVFREHDHVCVFVRHEERPFVDLLFGKGEDAE
jgi:cell volume regulation protein A